MKTHYTIFVLLLSVLIANGCKVTEKSQRVFKFSIQAGLNKGGITENTDLTIVPYVEPDDVGIDAFSGATRTGANIGVHINEPLRYGEVETGLDFMLNHQTFKYADAGNAFTGIRNISMSQFMIPLTYNFVLFKGILPSSDIQLKFGFLTQVNIIAGKDTGDLPDYTVNPISNGILVGVSAYPLQFRNGSRLGFYANACRGSQIYVDYYNQKSFEIPGSSFITGGIRFQFK
jgi:hypothetical protein